MKFGLFYELQVPAPWNEDSELKVYQEALEQIELADKVGFDCAWEVEHHFLEEYSHSSAPEVFLAAASQRTKNIRLGHGVMLMSPKYNHPARSAERIAALDLVSNGRVEWGTGESASAMELGGFNVSQAEKTAMWQEGAEQAANMLAMTPYPGFEGKYFDMPCRNIIPKPKQKPHPPMWMACSRRETIQRAAYCGLGALGFAFVEPDQAHKWVQDYYNIIKSDKCVPLAHIVNPNIALVAGLSVHENEEQANLRGLEGFKFFGYSLGYVGAYGRYRPGRPEVYNQFDEVKRTMKDQGARGGIGTPDQVRKVMMQYENIGVDQIIFVQQCGKTKHEDICESIELFGRTLIPEFKERESIHQKKKDAEMAPYIEAALKRKKRMPEIKDGEIEVVESFGLKKKTRIGVADSATLEDRGGGIIIPQKDAYMTKKHTQ
ncbi:MAG: LLM class flavin-dependent oxidoreductase [Candidatus Marinimicrobia bacterium]|nr:LLM class flavin-dependent oxidoreductase [Candidatus Neomarinimicrobiota bacterium]